jgi:hypothetical protein
MRIPEQPCPVGPPHEQAPQVRVSLTPVTQLSALVPAGQLWEPSNIAHFADALTGTQNCPVWHPPPTIVAAQKRSCAPQMTAPGVPVPLGVHAPFSTGVNGPGWMP